MDENVSRGIIMSSQIEIPESLVEEFCLRNHIQRLAFFGSVLRENCRPDSDLDVLVEINPGFVPGLMGMARLEHELSVIFKRQVDLRTPEDLSHYFRQQVLDEAEIRYES